MSNDNLEPHPSYSGMPNILGVAGADGLPYSEFKKTLKPNYFILFFNMALPWLMISVSMLLPIYLKSTILNILYIFPCSLWVGFWIHAYSLHFHEAGHFNLLPNRHFNDIAANLILMPFNGILIADYRISHWKHHRYLGLSGDTEISYHNPISFKQILEGISGIYLLKSGLRYLRNFKTMDQESANNKRSTALIFTVGLMMLTQLLIAFFLYLNISIYAALIWVFAFFLVSPFLAQLRQCLEHRSTLAKSDSDYTNEIHGPVNRIFGDDFLSRYFGAAGFNKHLLHHCDPFVSYTRFCDLQNFLLGTKVRKYLIENTSTYKNTFLEIANK